MREILFRGQTRRHGEKVWMNGEKVPSNWVYGGIFQGTGDFSVIYGADKEDFTGSDIGKHTVYTDTVGQFTGLTDKNGKRVFEGDIVRNADGYLFSAQYPFAVKFCDGNFCGDAGGFVYISGEEFRYCEVIGNIHDNPELLEVGE